MASAIDTIKTEHANMARVLTVLEETVATLPADAGPADLEHLHAMVYYIRVFPDRLHHPKEEKHLFAALRRRAPESAALLAELEHQHREGGVLLATLDAALKGMEAGGPAGLQRLRQETRDYLESQRRHMATEEREVLPLARERLTAADWADVDHAFAAHSDPLFGENLATGFQALYRRITGAKV